MQLRIPTSLAELTELMDEGFCALAGGTDVLVAAGQTGEPHRVASTSRVAELAGLDMEPDTVRVGGSVVLSRLARDQAVRAGVPALIDGAELVGSIQLRNSATLVGNLCTASPAGDTIPGLFVHDAVIKTVNSAGVTRVIAVRDFFTGPRQTVLAVDELVTTVSLTPLISGEGSAYRRFTERNALDPAFAGVAGKVCLEPDGETVRSASLALGAVAPTVIDASKVADSLVGRPLGGVQLQAVAEAAAAVCEPISDLRCSADYRRQLVRVLTIEALGLAGSLAARNCPEGSL